MSGTVGYRDVLRMNLRLTRVLQGLSQDALARRAARLGLTWNQNTVSALEMGYRQLTVGEWILLPVILGCEPIFLASHCDAESVDVDGVQLTKKQWLVVAGCLAGAEPIEPRPELEAQLDNLERRMAMEEATRKMARSLGWSVAEITAASLRLWGHGPTEERDARLAKRAAKVSPRALQALRGHMTRRLIAELARATA